MTNGLLRSWERRSHYQNNFGNAVPRRSRWKRPLSLTIFRCGPVAADAAVTFYYCRRLLRETVGIHYV